MTRIRFGIVGCGAVTERYHLPAIVSSTQIELTALADVELSRARSLAERFGAPFVTDRHDELPGRVDVAVIATPNRFHAPVAIELLKAGVHVLVEKPMALDSAECDAMIEAAAASGTVLGVGHDFRFFPVARYAKALLETELLGTVSSVDLRQGSRGRWPYASGYVYSREEAGGGVLIDFGSHMLDLLMWWLGDAQVVSFRDDAVGGVEAECEVELAFGSGAKGFIELTRARDMRDTFVLDCERGTLEIACFEPSFVRLSLPDAGGTLEGDVVDREFAAEPLLTVFSRQHADFAEAVRGGREPLVSAGQGRRVIAAVEACYGMRQPLRKPWDVPEVYDALRSRVS